MSNSKIIFCPILFERQKNRSRARDITYLMFPSAEPGLDPARSLELIVGVPQGR